MPVPSLSFSHGLLFPARPRLRILLFLVLAALAVVLAATRLSVNPDTDALLSESLPWRQQALELRKAFPQLHRNLVFVIQADDEAARLALAAELTKRLQAQPQLFASVQNLHGHPYLAQQALLLLTPEELRERLGRLQSLQPLLEQLAARPQVDQLFEILAARLPPAAADGPDTALPASVAEVLMAPSAELSWPRLAGLAATGPGRLFVTAQATSRTVEAQAYERAQAIQQALLHTAAPGLQLGITGEIALWQDEIRAANEGALYTGLASFLLVSGILVLVLRRLVWVLACLSSLAVGLALTAGYASVAVGRLNLISVAFAALFIGLAIDFVLHWMLSYRAAVAAPAERLRHSQRRVGPALLLCAATTAIAFLTFVPTDYQGVAELGHIGAVGILIGLLCALLLLPAILLVLDPPGARTESARRWRLPGANWAWRKPRSALFLLLLLAGLSGLSIHTLRFDLNPSNLKPDTPALQLYRALLSTPDSPMQAVLLTEDPAQARQIRAELLAMPQVAAVRSIQDWLPGQQDEKLERIAETRTAYAAALPHQLALPPVDGQRLRQSARDLLRQLQAAAELPAVYQQLGDSLDQWLAQPDPEDLQRRLLGTLPNLIAQLSLALQAQPMTLQTIPEALRRPWVSETGAWRLQILPQQPLQNSEEIRGFVDELRRPFPDLSGSPVELVGGADTVIRAFVQAFASALLAVALILLLVMRRLADAALALAPLLLGALLYLALTAALGWPLNFANIIALPLLFGIAIDTGIHLIWRWRAAPQLNPADSDTGDAVLASVLTTLASFCALTFSPHPGMASMGLHLAVGLLSILLCTVLALPALLRLRVAGRS